jgi:hypothetical protein
MGNYALSALPFNPRELPVRILRRSLEARLLAAIGYYPTACIEGMLKRNERNGNL